MKAEESKPRPGINPLIRVLIYAALVSIALAVAVPSFIEPEIAPKDPLYPCMNNQANIDGAILQYMLANPGPLPERIELAQLVGENAYLRSEPICRGGGVYQLMPLDRETTAPLVRCSLPDHPFPE